MLYFQKLSSSYSTTKSQQADNNKIASTDEKPLTHEVDKEMTQSNDQKDKSMNEGTKNAIAAKESSYSEKSVTDKKTEKQESESKPHTQGKQEVKSDSPPSNKLPSQDKQEVKSNSQPQDKQKMGTEKSQSKSCIVL